MRFTITKLAIPVALAALLGGCATQQPERLALPPAPIAAAYPADPADPDNPAYPAGASAPGGALPAAQTGWRDFLRDPRLQQLVELALHNNRDLRIAALNVEKVRAQYQLARAALAPQVTIGASAQRQGSETLSGTHAAVTRNVAADLGVSWELDFFGRLHGLSNAAQQQYLSTQYARQAAQLLLVSQVADQYLALRAADEQLQVIRETLDAVSAAARLVTLQYQVGSSSELEAQQAQGAVELAQANLAAQQRVRAQAMNALVLLVGQPLPEDSPLPPPLPFDAPALLADIPAGLPSDLLARRPDIAQAEAQLQAYHADVAAARAAFFPRISMTGTLGSAAPALSALFGAGTGAWSFAPSLLAPLFDGGANQANLDSARVQRDIGVAQYEKVVQGAFREVADGLAARGTYDAQLAALQRYAASQQRRLELATRLYANGIDNYLEVLTAQTDAYAARSSVVTARLNRMTSLVDLYRALGGGWLEHSGPAAIGYASADNAAARHPEERPSIP